MIAAARRRIRVAWIWLGSLGEARTRQGHRRVCLHPRPAGTGESALAAAVSAGRAVLPLFVFDEMILRRASGQVNRLAFLLGCLRELDASLREAGGGWRCGAATGSPRSSARPARRGPPRFISATTPPRDQADDIAGEHGGLPRGAPVTDSSPCCSRKVNRYPAG
jgi:hypothetical protein